MKFTLGEYVDVIQGKFNGESGMVIARWVTQGSEFYEVVLLSYPPDVRNGRHSFRTLVGIADYCLRNDRSVRG